MKKSFKRILATVLTVVMVMTAVPLSGIADFDWGNLFATKAIAADLDTTGQCGDNVYWTFDESTGLLTLSGTGKMYYYNSPFVDNALIKTVVIEDGVTSIGQFAFEYCNSLTSITIPDSVTSIGSYAFDGCTSLTSVTIPDSVTSIDIYAFECCENLESVTIGNSVVSIGDCAFDRCLSLTSMTIPDSVTSLGRGAFEYCYRLTSVTIGNSVTSIGEHAFEECASLTDITIGNSVTSIGDCAFCCCPCLTSITIPDSVTSIGNRAFEECNGLTNITIPDSVTSIGDCAFYDCINLTHAKIPDSVTSIGNGLYYGCYRLVSIMIPDSVTSIGDYAFEYCDSLTSITIPDSVIHIGIYTFDNCTGLTDIYYSGSPEQWSALKVSDVNNATIHYYYGCEHSSYEFDSYITEPDCIHEGTANFRCVRCGETKVDSVPAQHSLRHMTLPATCTQPGSEYDICTSCFIMQNYQVIPAKGHTWGEWIVDEDATCTEDGSKHRFCTECEEGQEDDVIPATGHNYEHMVIPAECEKSGTEYDICKNCLDTKNIVVLPTLGHTWSEWIIDPEATCTDDGLKYRVCETCEKREEITLDAFGHSYVDTVTAPTCEEQGYTTHVCSTCGDMVKDSYVSATGHKYEWVISINPTTSSTGVMENKCEYCGAVINTMTIPRLLPDSVEKITLSSEKEAVALGETMTLTATVLPETAKNKNVVWKSSDTDVATVSDGTVTALKPGVAVITAQAEGTGFKEYCLVRVEGLKAVNVNTVIDAENGLVYGFDLNSTDVTEYIDVVDDSMTLECGDSIICTGSQINILCNGKIIDTYEAVIFGDANHDGWYDGTDSIVVNCLANELLSKEQVGDAVYTAADCNHDGVIDENDVAILEQAGLILASVDQSKSPEEFMTDSAYVEYLNLIDQNPTEETTAEETTDVTPTDEPVDEGFNKSFVERLIDFIINLVNLIKSFIAKF